MAEKLGVSAQSVSRWETNATFPDILLLPEIAQLYDVLVDDLFKENLQEHGKLFYRWWQNSGMLIAQMLGYI